MRIGLIIGILVALVILVVIIVSTTSTTPVTTPPVTTDPGTGGTGGTTTPPVYTLPAGVSNGDNIAAASSSTYYVENNTRRAYPSAEIYQSYGSPTYKTIDYTALMSIPAGAVMPYKTTGGLPTGFGNGDIVSNGGLIFKIDTGKLRKFPSTAVYATWGSPAAKPITDGAKAIIPVGVDMTWNIVNGLPGNVSNGQNVRNSGNMGIYLIAGGKSRWYPSAQIYQSYGAPAFTDLVQEIFTLIPIGDTMPDNTPVTPTPTTTWQTLAQYGESMNLIRTMNVRYGTTGNGITMPAGDLRCIAGNFGASTETNKQPCQIISTDATYATKYTVNPVYPNQTAATNAVLMPVDPSITMGGKTIWYDPSNPTDKFVLEKNRWRRFANCDSKAACFNLMSNPNTVGTMYASQRIGVLEGQPYG